MIIDLGDGTQLEVDCVQNVVLRDVYSGVNIPTVQGRFEVAQQDCGIAIWLDDELVWSSHAQLPCECRATEQVELQATYDRNLAQMYKEQRNR